MPKAVWSILVILVILVCGLLVSPLGVVTLYDETDGELVMARIITPDDEFSMRWIHSVELTPWEEIFHMDEGGQLMLIRTRFQQFGAGVPDSAGDKTEIIDGWIVFSGINQPFDNVPYGITHSVQYTFTIAEREYYLPEIVEDGNCLVLETYKLKDYLLSKIFR